ncbi:hypothetical protein AaE_008125 [Aphanomyces astaci]|uniref:Kinesin-like protein n=1 Tax=Aphanomyces astaci TaxID=112090 RepID=A0A6A5A889_APHAT|nr:hypothetical protein AaE_008125 [Aphanomyces astaci]
MMLPTRMQVAVRLRPRLTSESHEAEAVLATSSHRVQLLTTPRARRPVSYKFDHVFTPHDSNQAVFDAFLAPLVLSVLEGTHATVLAYGQTGTGKTFTMLGRDLWGLCAGVDKANTNDAYWLADDEPTQRGLMYLVADALLASRRGPVTCSYLELYNEKVYDLTQGDANESGDKVPLDLREDAVHGVFLPDLRVLPLHSLQTLTDILWTGAQTRASRATNMNERSSRSHTILQLHVDTTDGTTATMNLVDLAGSEKCKKHISTPRHHTSQDMKERLQKRTLLFGFTSLLNGDAHAKAATSSHGDGIFTDMFNDIKRFYIDIYWWLEKLAHDLWGKLCDLEHAMESQLHDVRASKLALSTTAKLEPQPTIDHLDVSGHPEDEVGSSDTTTTTTCWDEYVDAATGFKYFHNAATGVTTWTKPPELLRLANAEPTSSK